jgi:spermidine/putrescine-binding protein
MKNKIYKKIALIIATTILAFTTLSGCGNNVGVNGQVIVYNWGEYLDPDTIKIFEKETGIRVIYDEYETNEIMYPKIESGSANYDVLCPSDYMIQKLLENNLLRELNFDNMPNSRDNIGAEY